MKLPLWRKIQKTNFSRIGPLLDFLELSPTLKEQVFLKPRFVLNLPYRLAEKIQKNTLDDPILRQFVPLIDEEETTPGFVKDPVQDKTFQKTEKILHKYKSRALVITTSACAMHCRYCFRQNFPYETEIKGFEQELTYLQQDPTISEVILSGGDPLSLSDEALESLFSSLDKIGHVKRVRIHTRFPIGIPERIDEPFLNILKASSKQIFFVIHANHSRELDSDVMGALKKIQKNGIPVLNQSVLLKGVNDSEKELLDLSIALINGGIIPYYLHLLDPVEGTAHFDLPEVRAKEILKYVQENLSGFGVPRLAREEPGLPSKSFI